MANSYSSAAVGKATSAAISTAPEIWKFGKIYRFKLGCFAKTRKFWKFYRSEVGLVAKIILVVTRAWSKTRKTFTAGSCLSGNWWRAYLDVKSLFCLRKIFKKIH